MVLINAMRVRERNITEIRRSAKTDFHDGAVHNSRKRVKKPERVRFIYFIIFIYASAGPFAVARHDRKRVNT